MQKDDYVFGYNEVLKVYNDNKSKAKGWNFQTLETGSHEFIYKPEISKELLIRFFSEILNKKTIPGYKYSIAAIGIINPDFSLLKLIFS
jgi:hypothetical protein